MAERAAGFPQPSHGACEGGRAGFVPARAPARGDASAGPVASPRPPGSADSRPGKNDRRDAGGRARLAPAGEAGPARVPPERAGGPLFL